MPATYRSVGELTAMKKSGRLVAVAGLGLSQQETVDAARELSKADLPMVGDLITADGLDATGAVDAKGPINGLARVALTNTDQLEAISKELGPAQRTAALVSTSVTPNGTKDLYTESLNRGPPRTGCCSSSGPAPPSAVPSRSSQPNLAGSRSSWKRFG
ncbi:hypothetical protein ACWCP6_36705 [Streptomyces sp. NPDC002004]